MGYITGIQQLGTNPCSFFFVYHLVGASRTLRHWSDWSQDLAADVEIFNTYGEFSNDKLLQDYGFVLVPGRKPHRKMVKICDIGEMSGRNCSTAFVFFAKSGMIVDVINK